MKICLYMKLYLDINECNDHCKADNVTCNNLNGTYECVCPGGYFFNNVSLQCQGVTNLKYNIINIIIINNKITIPFILVW